MSERNGWSWLRLLTPFLISISLFLLTQIWAQLNELNTKLYAHVTNAELHIPRSEFISLQNQLVEMRRDIIATIRKSHEER